MLLPASGIRITIGSRMNLQPSPTFMMRQHDVSGVVHKWSSWCSVKEHDGLKSTSRRKLICLAGHDLSVTQALDYQEPSPSAALHSDSESVDLSSALELPNVRESLIRQEDTIIFSIIERAQFAANRPVYQPDAVPVPEFSAEGQRYSLLEYILRQTEQLHGRIRRFTSPDEHAFYPDAIPNLVLPPLKYPQVLPAHAKDININAEIMVMYREQLLPAITVPKDDGNYGSSACYDVLCLQALSKRIHYGKFVAEAKFQSQRSHYVRLIQQQDADGIMDSLTDVAVEHKVVDRVRWKAATYGQDSEDVTSGRGSTEDSPRHYKVSPDTIAMLYEKWVMPMTKRVQVQYLLRRLDS